MSKKFIIILLALVSIEVVALLAFSNTTNNETGYKISSYLTEAQKDSATRLVSDLCLKEEYTPQNVTALSDSIVVATVISLDDVDAAEGLFGTTSGKLLVQKSLKGELKEGQVVRYLKNGGIMKMSEWEENQPLAARQKREYLREQSNIEMDLENTYINVTIADDVDICEGYTYLINLKKYDDRYEIVGLGEGLREVNVDYTDKVEYIELNMNSLKIKNNKTNEFESLNEYINTYIYKVGK